LCSTTVNTLGDTGFVTCEPHANTQINTPPDSERYSRAAKDDPEDNLELARAGSEAFGPGDLEACVQLVAAVLVMNLTELPEPRRGRDTWRAGAEMIKRTFPDLRAEIDDIIAGEPARARRDKPARVRGGTLCTRRPAESMMCLY
jgi:hypothetical protein